MPHTIPATWVRGGTSKCWVFEREDLELLGWTVDDVLLRLFGSPDPRQLDGIGGATSTTSKAVIVERSADAGADVDYTFAQVGITEARVDWASNCGNCSAAVAPYVLDRGWVTPTADETIVRVRNTNTGQLILQRVATPGGVWSPQFDTEIPGVAFAGIGVGLGFVSPAGKTTGQLLPTGNQVDALQVGVPTVMASLVDAGAPMVIITPQTAGLDGVPYSEWARAVIPALPALETIRRSGAVAMGLASHVSAAARAVPKLAIVGSPEDPDLGDLDVLMLSMGEPHPALPITGSVGLTVAGTLPSTIVGAALPPRPDAGLRIRTPAGTIRTWHRRIDGADVFGTLRTARVLARAELALDETEHSASGTAQALLTSA